MTTRTRSLLSLGSPLKGYVDSKDKEQEQKDKYKSFYTPLRNPLKKEICMKSRMFFSPYRTKAATDDMDVEWFAWAMMSQEFSRIFLGEDFFGASIYCRGHYMDFGTHRLRIRWRPWHVANSSFDSILVCLLQICVGYSVFFSNAYLDNISSPWREADDVFVLNDAWKQSCRLSQKGRGRRNGTFEEKNVLCI